MTKAELRAQQRAMRGMLGDQRAAADAVLNALLRELGPARSICIYYSIRKELPTRAWLFAAHRAGHQVSVPRIVGDALEAREVQFERGEPQLVAGALRIPTSDGAVIHPDVVVCPGLAFDARGGRLGYGGGYYDRFLAHLKPLAVGVGVDAALVNAVPAEPHDVRMDWVITPSGGVMRSGLSESE